MVPLQHRLKIPPTSRMRRILLLPNIRRSMTMPCGFDTLCQAQRLRPLVLEFRVEEIALAGGRDVEA